MECFINPYIFHVKLGPGSLTTFGKRRPFKNIDNNYSWKVIGQTSCHIKYQVDFLTVQCFIEVQRVILDIDHHPVVS